MISRSRRQKRQMSGIPYSSSGPRSGQTSLDLVLLPSQVPPDSQVCRYTNPKGRKAESWWAPRFIRDLLQRASCLSTKRSINTEKTLYTENPPLASTSSIIKNYLAPLDPWRAATSKTCLTSSTSGFGFWKS